MSIRGYAPIFRHWAVIPACVVFLLVTAWAQPTDDVSGTRVPTQTRAPGAQPAVKGSSTVHSALGGTAVGPHWQLAGVTATPTGLDITYSGLAIVNQDGTPNQDNPPVNLYGTALQVRGDFSVAFQLSDITGESIVSLYGTPPLVEDEFRAEEGTLAMSFNGSIFSAAVSEQPDGTGIEHTQHTVSTGTKHSLTVTDENGKLAFTVDGTSAGAPIDDHGIFARGTVFFGFEAAQPDGHFHLALPTYAPINGGNVDQADTRVQHIRQDPSGFAALAQKRRPGFLVGASIALGPMVADTAYGQILGNFNVVTTENAGKFQTIHPLEGNKPEDYNFADMDAIVSIARQAGMKVHGHTLVFGEANPAWLQKLASRDPSRLQQVMTEHIATVVRHYKDQVEGWDVINEPLADYGTAAGTYGLRQNIWYKAMGPNYIVRALQSAHAADPSAGLWINEFGLETDDDRFNQMLDLVRWLQSQHVPLTGIGFQAHIDRGDTIDNDTHIDTAKLASRFAALQKLGLKARISELDITSGQETLAYGDIVHACLVSPACVGVTIWGVTDAYSSSGSLGPEGVLVTGTGLPWNAQEKPLPGVAAIQNALK